MRNTRIPLFRLNVVLLPGAALPLHIFEPRYRSMVRHCLEALEQVPEVQVLGNGLRTDHVVLVDANRLMGRHDQAPKIGLDGKYQFNMYDPDEIRSELMNLHATEKPCCSQFTAEDPAE